ncbi:hypothetical protein M408DRAFT_333807, partial [Serendipita vermifera MAFF 305830]
TASSGLGAPNITTDLLDLAPSITASIDLRDPLKLTSAALMKVLDTAEGINTSNEDWHKPFRRLLFHFDTIESQSRMLEEDFQVDETIPSPDPTVLGPLETYASQLNNIYQLLGDPKTTKKRGGSTGEIIAQAIRDIDDVFEKYTDALRNYAAQSIVQIKQEPALPDSEPLRDDRHKTLKAPNVYGIQHVPCVQGTREKTIKAIRSWAEEKSSERPIFLLLDVAGSGKSTVAKHMANEWTQANRLMARYFFSRDTATTMSTSSFCATVADALYECDDRLQTPIQEFKNRKDFGLLSFEEVFNGIVVKPLEVLDLDAMLIIDALDECNNEDGSRSELLNALRTQHSSTPRLRVLATGRPELDIKQWAQDSGVKYVNFFQLEGGDRDVELYIKHRLRSRPHVQDRLYHVIKKSDGVFIWARIACDLILDTVDVEGLLDELDKEVSLDFLYRVALGHSIPRNARSRQALIVVLEMILASREPLSIAELEVFSPKRGIVEETVNRLGAVLLYKDREDPIRLLHATFREFLTNRSRARVYFIEPRRGHQTLALGCFRTISRHSSQDGTTLRGLDKISQRKEISLLIRDLLTSWGYHCIASYRKLALEKHIVGFARNELLTWADRADKWYSLGTVTCLRNVLVISRQKLSPMITEITTSSGLKTVRRSDYDLSTSIDALLLFWCAKIVRALVMLNSEPK